MTRILGTLLYLAASCSSYAMESVENALRRIEAETQKRATVGSTQSEQEILKAPSIVKSYNQRDLRHFDSLYDFLNHVPGVLVTEDRFAQRFVQVRGINQQVYNNRVLVLINGHRVAFELAPETSLDVVPISSIQRLEIIRGPGAVLHGSSAYSAVIHITTRDGSGYEGSLFRSGLGTDGRRYSELSLPEFVDPDESYFFSARFYRQNGANRDTYRRAFVDGAGLNIPSQLNYARFLDYELQEQSRSALGVWRKDGLSVTAGAFADIRTLDYTRLFLNPRNRREFNRAIPFASDRINELRFMGASYERDLGEDTLATLRAKYSEASQTTRDNNAPYMRFEGHSHDVELEARLLHQASDKLRLTAGFSRQDLSYGQSLALGGNLFDMVPPTAVHKSGLYLQAEYDWTKRLHLLLGYRQNRHSLDPTDNNTPKAALIYALNANESLKLIYGEAFRYPSGYERLGTIPGGGLNPNPKLNAETLRSVEFSWLKSMRNGRESMEFTVFDIHMDDFITRMSTSRRHENQGSYQSQGLEIDWEAELSLQTKLSVHFSVMDFKSRSRQGLKIGQYHHSTLKRKGSLRWTQKLNERLKFQARTLFIGKQEMPVLFAGALNPRTQGSYALTDIILEYSHSPYHSFEVRVENAFDKEYLYPDYDLHYSRQKTYPEGRQIQAVYSVRF